MKSHARACPPPDHETGAIEAEDHGRQGGEDPGPGGGRHQVYQIHPRRRLLRVAEGSGENMHAD